MADPGTPQPSHSSFTMSMQSDSRKGHTKSKRISSTPVPSDVSLEVPEVGVEKEKPVSEVDISADEVDSYTKRLREAFKRHLVLSDISKESWTEESEQALDKFISDSSVRLLIVYHDPFTSLCLDYAIPAQVVEHMSYFIQAEDSIITEESFRSSVQFGSVRGGAIEGLLRLMNGVHTPQVTLSTAWPATAKNNYSLELRCFLSKLTVMLLILPVIHIAVSCLLHTDSRYKLLGSTVLYVPLEALQHRPEETVTNKSLVRRLEMVMIHWTRQIKTVLSPQSVSDVGNTPWRRSLSGRAAVVIWTALVSSCRNLESVIYRRFCNSTHQPTSHPSVN